MDLDALRGSTTPRLYPRPLVGGAPGLCGCGCAHTRETTYGFDVDDFARETLRRPLDPWERWLVIHAGELLPDGRPRFKKLLIIVARQNGKTFLLMVLTLFWLFVDQWRLIVAQHTRLAKAKEVWEECQVLASRVPELKAEFGYVRKDNNDPHWRVASGGKYMIEAANENGGRGGSVDRLVVDELRQQRTFAAYHAAKPTLNAKPFGQGWWISNQGDVRSVVLLFMRSAGMANIGGEEAPDVPEDELDPEIGLFEWSAPPGSEMTDPLALAAANPNVGYRVSIRTLLADARAAVRSGDRDAINGFKTEIMCMYVPALDGALDPEGWKRGFREPDATILPGLRARLALVPELSPDQLSASISVAATLPSGEVMMEVIADWSGKGAPTELRRALPGWIRRIKPRKVGWIPNGPTAAIAASLDAKRLGVPGLEIEEIRGEVTQICMGLAELVEAGEALHSSPDGDRLTVQALGAAKLWVGDGRWRFSRKGEGHVDSLYGVAGAAHLARTMPPGPGSVRLITGSRK